MAGKALHSENRITRSQTSLTNTGPVNKTKLRGKLVKERAHYKSEQYSSLLTTCPNKIFSMNDSPNRSKLYFEKRKAARCMKKHHKELHKKLQKKMDNSDERK